MSQTKPPYPSAFKQQIVELVAAGRNVKALAAEFGCCSQSINHWVKQAAIDRGEPPAGHEQH
jgi:transposase